MTVLRLRADVVGFLVVRRNDVPKSMYGSWVEWGPIWATRERAEDHLRFSTQGRAGEYAIAEVRMPVR